jgi:hypothetical protein
LYNVVLKEEKILKKRRREREGELRSGREEDKK